MANDSGLVLDGAEYDSDQHILAIPLPPPSHPTHILACPLHTVIEAHVTF